MPPPWLLQALRDLTGAEPQYLWVTRHHTAIADLLLLPPEGFERKPVGGAGRGDSHAHSHMSPAAPLAVLLLGPEETTR